MTARKKKKTSATAKKSRPPLPPRPRPKTTPPPPAVAARKATGFSSLIRGVADAAVLRQGAGGDVPEGLPSQVRGLASSMPEISIRQGPAGRSTLDAIAKDAGGRPAVRVTTQSAVQVPQAPRRHESSLPDISVAYLPGGRETLAAIQSEISGGAPADSEPSSGIAVARPEPPTGVRERRTTLGFEDRPLKDASGRTMIDSAPEVITLEESPIGRATLAAIAAEAAEADDGEVSVQTSELDDETLAAIQEEAGTKVEPSPRAPREMQIHEVITFVIRGLDPQSVATQDSRKALVAKHIMHRLPVWSLDDVDRVDLARSDDGSYVVLQIMCRLSGEGH